MEKKQPKYRLSAETKERMRQAKIGVVKSDEHKANMKLAQQRRRERENAAANARLKKLISEREQGNNHE